MDGEEVVMIALRALATGKAQVVTGWKNKLATLAGSIPSRPLAARIAAKVIARLRLKQVSR
jgi:hypothetical protein